MATNRGLIALFDGVGEAVAPTANFTPQTGFPLTALETSDLFERCRTPDLTVDMQLTWHFPALASADVFALIGTNATKAVTARFRTATDSGFTTGVVQSGAALQTWIDDSLSIGTVLQYVPPWGRTLLYVAQTPWTGTYLRWHQSDIANPDGWQEWGIARVGKSWQPANGFKSADWSAEPKTVGSAGAEKVLRGHVVTFGNLTKAEAYQLQSYALSCLGDRRMLVIPEGLATSTYESDAIWCTLEGNYVRKIWANQPYTDKRYIVGLTFREVDN